MECIRNMTDDEFKHYCRFKNMKETDIIIADMAMRQEMSTSEIALATNYSAPTIKQRRLIIKAKLGM